VGGVRLRVEPALAPVLHLVADEQHHVRLAGLDVHWWRRYGGPLLEVG
jgi:hypothetical protein